jgi:hypothetical protein
MPVDTSRVLPLLIGPLLLGPEIRGWNRLEGRPRAENFERSLRAEVRDPLWFLTRQWQFGEFDGEDAGSPIEARLATTRTQLIDFTLRDGPVHRYDPLFPLEVIVEREPVPFDLVTHRQITQAFFRIIDGLADNAAIKAQYRSRYPLTPAVLAGYIDRDSNDILLLAQSNLLDGAKLIAEIRSGDHGAALATFAGLDAATRDALISAGRTVLTWFEELYDVPPQPTDSAWEPARLEYQFACRVGAADLTPSVLVADSYAQGHLDWFAFDLDDRRKRQVDAPGGGLPVAVSDVLSFVPAPVSFAGMPSPRYWEMEDRRIEFADLDAHTTDLAKLLLTEFALVFSNDWCVVPYEVEVGSLTDIHGLVVTDTFGERTLLHAAGRGRDEEWQRWTMFALATRATGDTSAPRLFVPPATAKCLEGMLLEKVTLLRDEMANLVWAVEARIPAASGAGIDGYHVARETTPIAPAPPPLSEGVKVRYVLGTDAPANWRPFIPVHLPGSSRSVRLQRARLPLGDRPIRGRILDLPSPYYIFEEEVPRSSTIVTRSFQRTRWLDGRVHLWLGRRRLRGRGEGSSGLTFDQVEG